MKKLIAITSICFLSLFFISCENRLFEKEEVKAERILRENLRKRYNEEFLILGMGKRGMNSSQWYECTIIPQSIVGTNRENDQYYWASGFIELENGKYIPGDTYGGVLLNESANKFFGKKLKELFGDNFLVVIDMEGPYDFIDFEEEMNSRKPLYEKNPKGKFYPIAGGIYIFGRVENEEDQEFYRKQIFEFIQFLKNIEVFEYVSLNIRIMDDRVFTDGFEKNKHFLIENFNKNKISDIFINYRISFLNALTEEYAHLSEDQKKKKIDNFNKDVFLDLDKNWHNSYTVLCHVGIMSPKYLDSSSWASKYKKINYDNKSDIKFLNTIKMQYNEHDQEKIFLNEWEEW
ncbi:MAG: hypothetical protein LBT51_08930 [Fusobacteriaceae bacterium]|jgi:hypothetical protein|nr:hypothetical protein [Fusobacteriaceae bacterium]